MPLLYSIHLSRHIKGFGKPCVRSIPAPAISGHWDKETKDIVTPDKAAVRNALPHYWRKAFDRASVWFPKDGDKPAYATLYNSRGRYLNTVYLIPYHFNP